MNRALIITVGIVIIILVLGVWVYLILFGTPEDGGDVFANLGFEVAQQNTTITPPLDNTPLETLVDTNSGDVLRQLTTRPIAGFIFANTNEVTSVRYAERGTGHIYEIDLETGTETILSGTTMPKVSKAVFSPNTNTVALTAYEKNKSNVFVGRIGEEGNIIGISLQPGAENISFSSDTEVLYTVSNDGTTTGYKHDILTLTQEELFLMNFSNLDVGWGSTMDTVYLATKPSQEFEGFIYTVKNNILTPATFSAYGLSALFDNEYILTTYIKDGEYTSTMVNSEGVYQDLPILGLKEKCVFSPVNKNNLWCGAPIQTNNASYVEDWYKGTLASNDKLWNINVSLQTAQLIADPENLTGRNIDIKSIAINANGTLLSFVNKTDHTLWLFDSTAN